MVSDLRNFVQEPRFCVSIGHSTSGSIFVSVSGIPCDMCTDEFVVAFHVEFRAYGTVVRSPEILSGLTCGFHCRSRDVERTCSCVHGYCVKYEVTFRVVVWLRYGGLQTDVSSFFDFFTECQNMHDRNAIKYRFCSLC